MRTHAGHLIGIALAIVFAAAPASAQITRVSVATDGTPGNNASSAAVISGNGRFVAFTSLASNLVLNDTNGIYDVFLRDLVGHTTERVSVTSGGAQVTAPSYVDAISDDGNVIVFQSSAALVTPYAPMCQDSGGAAINCVDIYVRDRTTGETTRVSAATDGTAGNGDSLFARVSGDGRFVVFQSSASNLVSGDTNGTTDVFLHDRITHITTRVSVDENGTPGTYGSVLPTISKDAKSVAFLSPRLNFGQQPDNGFCLTESACTRAFVRNLTTGTLRRLPIQTSTSPEQATTINVELSADGRYAAFATASRTGAILSYPTFAWLLDLVTNQLIALPGTSDAGPVAMSDDGRYVAEGAAPTLTRNAVRIFDRVSGLNEYVPEPRSAAASPFASPSFDATGRRLAFVALDPLVLPDDNGAPDVFVLDRDPDADGIPSFWETTFGLDPNNAADAALDPDGDNLTNLQEFQANSHPKATHTRYFAEGAANSFFSTRVAVLNPGATTATVLLHLLGANGQQTAAIKTVAANQRVTFDGPAPNLPDNTFSIVVESDQTVVADRLMAWDATGYGSHLETSIGAPGVIWYLAEGATGGPFSLYYLLQNPGDAPATVTVTYLLPTPQAPVVRNYTVAAHSRFTIDVTGEDPALAHAEVSAKIVSTVPIVVERSMYFSRPTQFLAAGHDGAGIAAPATRWFLAEGATGFFDEYVLIANADANPANIKVTYLLDDGTSFNETFAVTGNSRYTLDVKRDSRLASRAVSIIVESTNTVPVVVERVMWWPTGTTNWYEASLSAGVTATGTKWAIAEGEQGGPKNAQTYVLVANTDPSNVCNANVKLYFEDGTAPASLGGPVQPNSRATFDAGTVTSAAGKRFGITVDCGSTPLPIVVERSFYNTVGGVQWAAGATSVATNITPIP